jgi:hypothetical protein
MAMEKQDPVFPSGKERCTVRMVGDTAWLESICVACRKAAEIIPWEEPYLKAIAESIDRLVVTRFEMGSTEPEEIFKGTSVESKEVNKDV